MQSENPYLAPEADISLAEEQSYQPKFLSFIGRLNRARFICYSVTLFLLMIAPFFVAILLMQQVDTGPVYLLVLAFMPFIVFLFFNIAVIKRRFNDLGRSGWWTILSFIPYLGGIVLFYLMFAASDEGSNAWGLPAKSDPSLKIPTIICAPIYMLICIASLFGNDSETIKQFFDGFFIS